MEDMEGYFSESSADEREKAAQQERDKITSSVTKILSANLTRRAPMAAVAAAAAAHDTPTRRSDTSNTIESMEISRGMTPPRGHFGSNNASASGMRRRLFTTRSPAQRLSSSVTPRIKTRIAPSTAHVVSPPPQLQEVDEDEDAGVNNDSFMDIDQGDEDYSPPRPPIPSAQQQIEDEDVSMADQADFNDEGVEEDENEPVFDDPMPQPSEDDEEVTPRRTTNGRNRGKNKGFSFHDSDEEDNGHATRSPTPATQPIPEGDYDDEELDEVEIELRESPVTKRGVAASKKTTAASKSKTKRPGGRKAAAATPSPLPKTNKGKVTKKSTATRVTAGGSPGKAIANKSNAPLVSNVPEPASRQSSEELNTPGVRRSKRIKIAPLEFWKNERIIYSLDDSTTERPKIKTIIQVDESAAREREAAKRQALSEARKKAIKKNKSAAASKTKKRGNNDENNDDIDEKILQDLRKQGTLVEKSFLEASVFPYPPEGNERGDQLIAWGRDYPLRPAKGGAHRVASLFDAEAHFAAAGLLALAPHTDKPQKSSKHNHYFFFVATGAVRVIISDVEFTVAQGGSFVVPRGNTYSLANALPDRDARMFFVQCTDTLDNEQRGIKRKR
jgi:mannose-6-phosphate isomerase-like protein (cupin superfamily)